MNIPRVTRFGNAIKALPWLLLLLLVQLSSTTASRYYEVMREPSVTYELVCPEYEQLQDTMPCCEPTCDNNCTSAKCAEQYVHQPTCVCVPGYVRHKGKCIQPSQCPTKPPAPLTCDENEELLPSPPSCEPTCTDDCSGQPAHTRYIDQPTCVCKKGFRRLNGKCVRASQCPSCGPYATLSPNKPCCEPTCENDCSNVLCISAFSGEEPVCVCQDGYVKHKGNCIKRELCPQTGYPAPKQYCRCGKRKNKGRVPVKYVDLSAGSSAPCDCYKQIVVNVQPSDFYPTPASYAPPPVYVQPTYAPPTYAPPKYAPPTTCAPPKYAPPNYAPPSYEPPQYVPPQYAPPTPAPQIYVPPATCAPPKYVPPYVPPVYSTVAPYTPPPYVPPVTTPAPCYVPPVYTAAPIYQPPVNYGLPAYSPCPYAVTTPAPYYQQPPSSYQDQPYYAIPALKQCSCNINCGCAFSTTTVSPFPTTPRNLGEPIRSQMYNHPPISYNTASPFTTPSPMMSTPCPGVQGLPVPVYNSGQPGAYNPGSYQSAVTYAPYSQDQPYVKLPPPTDSPKPVDVTFIALPDPSCCGTTTPTPPCSLPAPMTMLRTG